ncbi:MAG: carboxypeptidase-like regulatory domain-containing protein [Armatimonadota bacterium]
MSLKIWPSLVAAASLMVVAMTQLPVSAAIYYVSTTGSDVTGNGSSTKPWASIDHADANSLLSAGDTVYVKSGTYYIDTVAKGGYGVWISEKSNGVTYQADPAGVTIQQTNTSGGTALVRISNWGYEDSTKPIVFSGFKVFGGSPGGINLWVYQARYVEVKDCVIDSTGFSPWYNLGTYTAAGVCVHNNVIVNGACAWDSRYDGTKWYNNTFTGTWGGYAMSFIGYQDGYQPGTCGNPGAPLTADRDEFINNIITSGNYGGLYIHPATGFTYPLNVIHDYNMFCNNLIPFGGQAVQAPHESTNVDPMLDSAYHPLKHSPAVDAGTDVGLPYYWLQPDIGAFETRAAGQVFDMHTAVWYAYATDGGIDVSPIRWRDDLQAMKKAGLDGAWTINPWADIRGGGDWYNISKGAWKEDAIAKLRHQVSYAESIGMISVLGMAYGSPPPSLVLDDSEFAYYLEYVDRVVRETANNHNVIYMFCDELLNTAWVHDTKSHPDLVAHHKNWCQTQNSNIDYWNGRWGTSYTWDNIEPAVYFEGNANRHLDYLRWMYAILRPRLIQIGDLVKSIAPDSLLGYHEWLLGGVTDPSESPLAGTDKFDIVSVNCYGGYADTVSRIGTLRLLFPGYPVYVGELGTATAAQPFSTKPYLDGQKCGYDWWSWWMTNTSIEAEQWNVIDTQGRRRSSFSLLPNASQYGTVRGVITNASTGAVMLNVGVVAGDVQVQSIDQGLYRLDLDPGTYTVQFAEPGYASKVVTGVVVTAGQDSSVNVALSPITNKVSNPGFNANLNGWSSQTLSSGGLAMISYDDVLHPTWGLFDAVEGQGYLVMGAWPSPGEKVVYQDVLVSPNTTYTLSWWENLVGTKFDGWSPSSADQWLKVWVDQAQGTTWGGPIINLHQVQESAGGWRCVETVFKTGLSTTKVRIKFDAKFVSGQSFTGTSSTPRVGIDCVQMLQSTLPLIEASSIADAKNRPDGTLVAVSGVGTACFPNASPACGYIESSDRSGAMKVYTTNTSISNPMASVRVVGHISTDPVSGEKEITDEYGVQNVGTGSVEPVGMINRSIGTGYGLSTMGLLVKTFGSVISIAADRKSFVVDDGSQTPVTVTDFGSDVPNWMQVGSFVELTGISSLVSDGGSTVKCLRVPQWFFDSIVPWRP